MEPQMQGNMKDRDIRGAALPIPPLGKTPVRPQRWTSNPGRHATSAPDNWRPHLPATNPDHQRLIMTNEYQEFMSFLGGVSSSINKFASDLGSYASGVDRALDSASDAVRSGLRQAEVLLGFKTEIVPPPIIHQGLLQRTQTWISRNRAETAAIIAFLGSGALAYYCLRAQESRYIRKRRARKAKNGGRTEVIGM